MEVTVKYNRILTSYLLALIIVSSISREASGQKSRPAANTTRPNILLILADDLGYHDVSYYGTPDIHTPSIDLLAASGMRFDNFYANSPVCSPTRAALLSGRYPPYVGVPGLIRTKKEDNWGYLDPRAVLLPALFKQAGYHTAIVGKWNLGLRSPNLPNERGFDHFHGWLDDMMQDYRGHRRLGINYMRLNEKTIDPEGHATDLFTQWAVDYIKEEDRKGSVPFFLYLAYTAPHDPIQPPEDWLRKVTKREPGISATRAKLVALIEHMDHGIGKVIQALKETGQYENTIIVFTSDNGGRLQNEADNGPYRDGKGSMYEGGLRVPATVTWSGHIRPASSTEHVALSMDVFPTLLEAAGITWDHPVEGRSFFPTLLGREQPDEQRPLFFTRREGWAKYGGLTIQAVRQGDWKLLQNSPFAGLELYDLKADPMEQQNLIDQHPEKAGALNALMMKHIQKGGRVPWQRPETEEQEFYPAFSWERVPVAAHFGKSDTLSAEEIQFLTTHFPVVVLEKGHAIKAKGSTEAGALYDAARIKKADPSTEVIFYMNSFIDYGSLYEASREFYKHPDWALKDLNGDDVLVHNNTRRRYDVSNAGFREWWTNTAAKIVKDPAIDGVFVDATSQLALNKDVKIKKWGSDKQKALEGGMMELFRTLREKIGDDELIIYNGLSGNEEMGPGMGLKYYRYADAAMLEHFTMFLGKSKEATARNIKAIQTAGRMGKVVIVKGWPEFTWQDKEMMKRPYAELEKLSRMQIDYPLACFLIAAGENAFFCYTWGYKAHHGAFSWYPEFDRPLGEPQGEAVKEGWEYTREFEHASVWVDIEKREAKIEWR